MALAAAGLVAACGGGGGKDKGGATTPVEPDLSALPIEARATQPQEYITTGSGSRIARGELLVTVRPGFTHEAFLSRLAAANMQAVGRIPEARIYQVRTAATTAAELAALKTTVLAWPEVLRATENYESPTFATAPLIPDDPGYKDSSWAFNLIGAGEAWRTVVDDGMSGRPVKVGVIDTAFQSIPGELEFSTLYAADGSTSQAALQPPAVTSGTATEAERLEFAEQFKNFHHGMHVAGLMAAKHGNATRTTGVAGQANVTLLAAQKASMMSNLANFARLVRSGARVVNLSFGSTEADEAVAVAPTWGDLIHTLGASYDFLAVFAAGNQPKSAYSQGLVGPLFDPTLPGYEGFEAARARILVVGALDGDGHYANYSAVGPAVQIVAPGGGQPCAPWPAGGPSTRLHFLFTQVSNDTTDPDKQCRQTVSRGIRSLRYDDGYLTVMMSGTSQAAPMVTGAAALILSVHPGLSAKRLKDLLVAAGSGDQVADALGVRHPKLRLDQALLAAKEAARNASWDAATYEPVTVQDTAQLIANVSCQYGDQSKAMANLPVEVYPLTAVDVNLAQAPAITDALGFHLTQIPMSAVTTYRTDLFFFYVAPKEGRNPVINRSFRLPSAWSGPAVRSVDVTVHAKSEQGCTGGPDYESVETAVFGLDNAAAPPPTPEAPVVTGMNFVSAAPARLEVTFSQPMKPTYFTTGAYVPTSSVWETTTKFVITFSSVTPGGTITLKAPTAADSNGFVSASGIGMAADVSYQFSPTQPSSPPGTITATITGGAEAGTYTFTNFESKKMFSFGDGNAYMPQLIATDAGGNRIQIEYCAVQKAANTNFCDNDTYGRWLIAFWKAGGGMVLVRGGGFSTTGAHPSGESIGSFGADLLSPALDAKVHIEGSLNVTGIPITPCGASAYASCDPAAVAAPKITSVSFVAASTAAPATVRVAFDTDMAPDYFTRGAYIPKAGKEGYWPDRRTFEMQLDWFSPGGTITFVGFSFRSLAGTYLQKDVSFTFPNG